MAASDEHAARRGRVTRRGLLRGLCALGGAGLLAACAGSNGPRPVNSPGQASPGQTSPGQTVATGDVREEIARELGIDVPVDLFLVIPTFEHLAGEDRRLLFGLADAERNFLSNAEAEVTVVRETDFSVVSGPAPATFYEDFGEIGVYGASLDFPSPGTYRVAVVTPDRAAIGALQTIDPASSPAPQVGDAVPTLTTPTVEDPGDMEQLCTRDPDCGMHGLSLDRALEEGRPTVLTIATPAYCQTAICGPVVDVIEGVKDAVERDDVAWIHVEVFEDAGETPADLVTALELPSEPWTFFIDADGTIASKLEGPTPRELVRDGVSRI